jgi:hypothetical protein
MFNAILSKKAGAVGGALGVAALVICIGAVGYLSYFEHGPTVTPEECKKEIAKNANSASKDSDAAGTLRIVGVWPAGTTINRHLCIAVAGVAKAADASQAAQPANLALFLNGRKTSDLTFKAKAAPDIQYVIYDLSIPADASSTGGKFWRELLAGGTERNELGVKNLGVGISRTASDTPEVVAEEPIKFRIYYWWIFLAGVFAMLALSLAFCSLAKHTTLLRDNSKADANGVPTGPYSLGRTQMALWLVLTVAGFIFIWLTLGEFLNLISGPVLVLLGINGTTGLAAIQIDKHAGGGVDDWTTQSFLKDLLYDGNGPQLQRIQVLAWTVILAIIFIWNAVTNFYFVAFDTNLLLLMGIANSMYIGFKA